MIAETPDFTAFSNKSYNNIRTITSVLIGFKKFYENTRFLLPYMFHTATQALVSK